MSWHRRWLAVGDMRLADYMRATGPVARAWAARAQEVLPGDKFAVEANDAAVSIRALPAGTATAVMTPAVMLSLPGTPDQRLQRTFQMLAEGLREVASEAQATDWPFVRAQLRVDVGPDEVNICWQSADDASKILRVRPIQRSELGL